MTKEQQLDWLCRLRSEIYVYMPQEWIVNMDEALTQSIKALSQEPQCTEHPCLGTLCRYYKEPCDDCIFEEGSKYCIEHCPHEAKANKPCDDAISRILKRMWNCRGKHTTSIDKVKMEQIIRDELPFVTQKSGKWIPVRKRLPEDGRSVLFCDIDNDIMVGYHVEGRPNTHFSQDGTWEDMKNVKAWMPLPKPYEPQERSE